MKDEVDLYISLGKPKKNRSYGSIWGSYKTKETAKKLLTEWTLQGDNNPCLTCLKHIQSILEELLKQSAQKPRLNVVSDMPVSQPNQSLFSSQL